MSANIAVLDIERRPALSYHWDRYNVNISSDMVVEESSTMCFAYKWVGKKKVHFSSTFHDGKEKMLQDMYDVLDKADIVVGYNSRRFDVRHMNGELWLGGLGKPSPFKQVDVMKVIKANMAFDSNKLDDMLKRKYGERKLDTGGFDLWRRCMDGDPKAWRLMRSYNETDVSKTEKVYEDILPWIGGGYHLGLYDESLQSFDEDTGKIAVQNSCGACGSTDIEERGLAHTPTMIYQKLYCNSCGSWSRAKKSLGGVDARQFK